MEEVIIVRKKKSFEIKAITIDYNFFIFQEGKLKKVSAPFIRYGFKSMGIENPTDEQIIDFVKEQYGIFSEKLTFEIKTENGI